MRLDWKMCGIKKQIFGGKGKNVYICRGGAFASATVHYAAT